MEIFSEEKIEFNIEQIANSNEDISDENNEDIEETVTYFTSNLAVNANNIYYTTVFVEYPSTSPHNSKGPS
ncbi:1353_t:CDS:2, partial [Cetraspora pellucida]